MGTATKALVLFVAWIALGTGCSDKKTAVPVCPDSGVTEYLAFQLFVSGSTEPVGDYKGLNAFISPAAMEDFFIAVQAEVGTSLLPCRKAAIMIGPLALDFSNDDIAALINESFVLASKYGIAVGFHVDEGKFWANRLDLWKNPDNIEWIDWKGTPNTSSYVSWVSSRLAPQMCFNAPLVKAAATDYMTNIAAAVKANLSSLTAQGKEYLYAGIIVGWEPCIYPDRDTDSLSGYHAMANEGYAADKLPGDLDQTRVNILHDFVSFLCQPLTAAGLPSEKTYSHVVFLPRNYYDSLASLNPNFGKRTYAQVNSFSLPEVAIGGGYSPGFSTYPLTGVLDEIYSVVNARGWASSEGTNMLPSAPPVRTGYGMESYLARHYNHGCRLVNIFAFHLRGDPFTDALNDASEGTDAIAAYKKFLSGAKLTE